MTRNLYLGTGFEGLAGVTSPAGAAAFVDQLWENVQNTDFRERAVAIADEIVRTRPDVVGLQEAVLWSTPALSFDFIQILLGELQQRGVSYTAVAVGTTLQLACPTPPCNIQLSFTERDALLVRSGLPFSNAQAHVFSASLASPNPAFPLNRQRSWQSADVEIGGRVVRVVNTHLEGADDQVQMAQAEELIAALAGSPHPILLLGDYNAGPVGADSVTYTLFRSGGYTDAWAAVHPGDPGYTCCQASSLMNASSTLSERTDIIFFRGLVPISAEVVGESPADRTDSGLWPSTHAGVVAAFQLEAIDEAVSATLQRLAVTRTRAVRATLDLDEVVSLRMELRRNGRVLASKVTAALRAGLRRVTLPVSDAVGAGRANVRLILEDAADNRLILKGSVRLPAP